MNPSLIQACIGFVLRSMAADCLLCDASNERFLSSSVAATTGPKMQLSESIPFLEKPPKLDGSLAGDVGFDPMGFSNSYDMNWLRVRI